MFVFGYFRGGGKTIDLKNKVFGQVKSGGCMGESGGVWGAQKLALNSPYITIWLSDNQLDKKAGSALV